MWSRGERDPSAGPLTVWLPELGRLIVSQKAGQTVRLEDVAVVADSTVDKRGLARYNRLPAVAIGVRKAIGGNLVAVCDAVRAEMPKLARLLPPGIDLAMPVDSSRFVRENIEELKLTLVLGVLLTAIVCYLFLGSLETTINICLSIPTSLLGTFFFLNHAVRWIGMEPFTLNLMTLLGLSLSVGVVVDDAILVLENIHRHREMGKDSRRSARAPADSPDVDSRSAAASSMWSGSTFAATSADRAKVIKDYAAVATLTGSATRGRELFTKNCGVCHKLKGEGREIGPDLGQVATRDTDWLLTAILDPNAAVESRYLAYTAETKAGREFTGIITAETPNNIVMKSADGTEETILRTDLKSLTGSGLSLMPEGMESALKPQDMADLLAFIRSK